MTVPISLHGKEGVVNSGAGASFSRRCCRTQALAGSVLHPTRNPSCLLGQRRPLHGLHKPAWRSMSLVRLCAVVMLEALLLHSSPGRVCVAIIILLEPFPSSRAESGSALLFMILISKYDKATHYL